MKKNLISKKELNNIFREEYQFKELNEKNIHQNPIEQFNQWFTDYIETNPQTPNAMTLATTDETLRPTTRIVLLKYFDQKNFVFFTNYNSLKGQQLAKNPQACLQFFWPNLGQTIRIEGKIRKTSAKESKEYFQNRPKKSQIAALISNQSHTVKNQETLNKEFQSALTKYINKKVPYPSNWGGYQLTPHYFEFWQGRPSRLHDRIVYQKQKNTWAIKRLYP